MRVSTAVCPVLCRCFRQISRRWWVSKCSAVWLVWCDLRQGSLPLGRRRVRSPTPLQLSGELLSCPTVRRLRARREGRGPLRHENMLVLLVLAVPALLPWFKTAILLVAVPRRASWLVSLVPNSGGLHFCKLVSLLVQCCNSFCVYPCIFLAVVCVVWCPVVTPGRLMALLIQSWAFEPSV